MKTLKIAALSSILVVALVLAGCGPKSSATATPQTAAVQRGNIIVSTTSTGNLAFTRSEDVAFEMAGTVQEVMVAAGDSVKEGQVLATLDTSAWEDQIKALQKAVTAAQRALTSAERTIGNQQLAVDGKQLDLQSAQNKVADIPAVKSAQDRVDMAEAALTTAQASYTFNPSAAAQIDSIRQQLTQAQSDLKSVLAGTGFNLTTDMALQIAQAQHNVQQSQRVLDDANIAVDNAVQARDDAKQNLDDAQSALKDAEELSPEVKAPFTGFVTTVNIKGGEEVKKGAVAVQVADPDKFEVSVLVGERDITSMAVGGIANVSVNSMTGVTLPATITAIAPTATVQQGVVNYQVTVAVQSTGFSGRPSSGNTTNGLPQSGLGISVPRTSTPQGQNGQIQGASDNRSARFGVGPGSSGGLFAAQQNITLRQGLSVTVNLVTASKSNVLMVPNRAVTRQQGKTYVSVQKADATEQMAVTTGISNSQFTEVTEGIAEGEVVLIPISTVTSSSSQQQRPGTFFGGTGGGAIIR